MIIHVGRCSSIIEAEIVEGGKVHLFSLSTCVHKSLLKEQWPCYLCDWDVVWETLQDSSNTVHKCHFQGNLRENSLCRLALCCLLEMSAPGLLLVYYFLSTYSLWVISSSFMALNIFCQPLPHSPPVQPSLSKVPDFAFLTSPNALHPNWTPNLHSRTYSTCSTPISGWWLLHFPVAQIKYFSIILISVSLPHSF